MALQAKRAHVGQIALPAAFRYGHDVVRIPERFSTTLAKSPLFQKLPPCREIQPPHVAAKGHGIDAALRTHAAIAIHDSFAQVAGVGPQSPLVNAGVGTKRAATARYLSPAPAT